mgnify:CR=1 FL=1
MLASAYQSDDYSLYFLDQKEKKWKVKGKDQVVFEGSKRQARPDWMVLDSSETKFVFNMPQYKIRIVSMSDMNDKKKHWYSRKKSPTNFDFRFSRESNMPAEMKYITNVTWRYYGDDAQDVYMNMFGLYEMKKRTRDAGTFSGTAYITPNYETGEGNFRVHITTDGMTMDIPVVPVINSEGAWPNFRARWAKYNDASAARRNNERAAFDKFRADTAEYFANNERYKKSVANVETVALRTFEIDNFGVWNCDRFLPAASNTVIARFVDEKGKRIKITKGYLVEKARNSVYTVNDFGNFRFDPKAENLFWAMLPDNNIGVIYPKEFAKHEKDKDGVCTFVMKVDDKALDSYANLKSVLSFN